MPPKKAGKQLDEPAVVKIVTSLLTKFRSEQDSALEAKLAELATANAQLSAELSEARKENKSLKALSIELADTRKENTSLKALLETAFPLPGQASGPRHQPSRGRSKSVQRSDPGDIPQGSKGSPGLGTNSTAQSWAKKVSSYKPSKGTVFGAAPVNQGPKGLVAVRTGYPVRVFVSRLSPTTTTASLEADVLDSAGVAVTATQLSSKMPRLYSSFLMSCQSTDLKTLLHPSVWVKGLVVKRWYDHPRTTQPSQTAKPNQASRDTSGVSTDTISAAAAINTPSDPAVAANDATDASSIASAGDAAGSVSPDDSFSKALTALDDGFSGADISLTSDNTDVKGT